MNTQNWQCWALIGSAWLSGLLLSAPSALQATPVNKAAFVKHYDRFLATNLNSCTTCHLPAQLNHSPESLDEFPHNPFGDRLRLLGKELRAAGQKTDLSTRLRAIAREDSDGDGIANLTELLLGHGPGDSADKPTGKGLAGSQKRRADFEKFLASYHWEPFQPVKRPVVPAPNDKGWVRNPIDAFIATEHQTRKLKPQSHASKDVLLRRVYLDLIGLSPTPAELEAFEKDTSPNAFDKVVDRLMDDPSYGERWGRHWMDIWRYSDWAGWTDGGQVRDSKPHIWRWRDWIIESLNQDKGYDQMILEMLAADELTPKDTNALRATGFLARNFKMLSREQWLEDTVKHTSQAFLGLTMGCAKCHNHMYDPIQQKEYYQMRAIFEPHQVRTDRVPGQTDTTKDGLVRVFDTDTNPPTYFFFRGDERRPDTNRLMSPGLPVVLGGALKLAPIALPRFASLPDHREFVIQDTITASEKGVTEARQALEKVKVESATKPDKIAEQEMKLSIAQVRHEALLAALKAEKLEDAGRKDTNEWNQAARDAAAIQRDLAVREAKLKLFQTQAAQAEAKGKSDEAAKALDAADQEKAKLGEEKALPEKIAAKQAIVEKAVKDFEAAQKKTAEAEKALAEAEKEVRAEPTTVYKPRPTEKYPATSTGRRLAFARWVASLDNPLTARVAMNHVWLRHFGQAIVPTVADFGANGRPPTHGQLLDWLAAEFMAQNWSMKKMHRLMVTSTAYRMSSIADATNVIVDPDNHYLWRMNSRRMEAEIVRDNVFYVSGQLDSFMGGPEVDHKKGLESKRRSIYLRIAAEKEVEFLKIFDSPSVTECYERKPSVMPQQALALANSELTLAQSRWLARTLFHEAGSDAARFTARAFLKILARHPTPEELELCVAFLTKQTNHALKQNPQLSTVDEKAREGAKPAVERAQSARESFILVLFNHNDFVTIR